MQEMIMANGQKVLVLGGSSGIGEAAAAAFLAAGASVTIAGRSGDRLEAAKARLGAVSTIVVDGHDAGSVAALAAEVGHLDHLVLTAGGQTPMGPFGAIGADGLATVVGDKLLTQARVAAALLPQIAPTGSITFTGGIAGQKAMAGMSAAAVTNSALEALTRVLAVEAAPVRVNVVVPGLVDTPAYAGMPDAARAGMFAGAAAALPVGRIGAPSDVGAAILMLATNGFITGTSLVIDGGAAL
jgi:NAD(P)-dependent dehydrogenase (short-subunit alcohol dehydrogenase family)